MDKIVVQGGPALKGALRADGAKNAALPLLFSTLLTDAPCRLTNVPEVADIRTTGKLLESLGAQVESPQRGELQVDCSGVNKSEAPYDLVRTMRASFLTLGPLLARFGRARVSTPGGCAIGSRPVDDHLNGLTRLGAKFELVHGDVEARVDRLVGGHVIFATPSVGATENVMMAAALAKGGSRIENAAREPEIVDLADAINSMGGRVSGAGSSVIEVEGVDSLGGLDHAVIPDRIVVGTYLIAGAITGGDVFVRGARADHLQALLEVLEATGCAIRINEEGIGVSLKGRPRPVNVTTAPHPGFPTDLQAQLLALLCFADGVSTVDETIFENRFMHVQELVRMGADIKLEGHRATVTGKAHLSGAPVMATDLRASVCLVLAGLAAQGQTDVLRIYHLDRGYAHLEKEFQQIGASIERQRMETDV